MHRIEGHVIVRIRERRNQYYPVAAGRITFEVFRPKCNMQVRAQD